MIVPDVVAEDGLALKAQPGGDMARGGADLAAASVARDLVDEYRLHGHPVLLGRGRPLFRAADATGALRPAGTRTFGNGGVLLRCPRPEAFPAG